MGDADVLVPETILERPRKRMKGLEVFRDEMLEAAEEIQTRIINIYQRFRDTAFNAQTDEGYLEIDIVQYERCFHIDLPKVQ